MSTVAEETMTPNLSQFRKFKKSHPSYILLFKAGDSYEAFRGDAGICSSVLGISMNTPTDHDAEVVPKTSVPADSIEVSLRKLIAAGYKVALCESIGDKGRIGVTRKAEDETDVAEESPGAVDDKKLKPLKKHEKETVTRWLKHYDAWLWGMRVRTYEAAILAVEDTKIQGVTPRRLAILAGKVCEQYCINKIGDAQKVNLNSSQWQRVMNWINAHRDEVIAARSVTQAATLAYWDGPASMGISAFGEALAACGITLPYKSERPAWKDSAAVPA